MFVDIKIGETFRKDWFAGNLSCIKIAPITCSKEMFPVFPNPIRVLAVTQAGTWLTSAYIKQEDLFEVIGINLFGKIN